jgi:cysteinyl-tRNA synthetase
MALYLFNTLTRKKEQFSPLHGKTVGMYTCGPTVYNYAHLGNLRTYLFEDILKRVLISDGYSVKHIMNITDVGHLTSDADEGEDKMEKGARREKKTVWDIAKFYTDAFKKNLKDLHIEPPTKWVRATDHIKEQLTLIQALESKGFTYKTHDGIYFDTSKFKQYADFAHLNVDQQQTTDRVEANPEKRNASDFALWKFSPQNERRAMEWPSPWGVGFPGWHLECSAMSMKYLGETFDIHAGGVDHIPVHHTNEIAQSEAATGKPLARVWLHGEFLVLKDEEKMAKSGTFITLQSVIDRGIDPLAYRLFTFSAHYRQKLTFSFEALEAAQKTFANLKAHIRMWDAPKQGCAEYEQKFFNAINDDLNMPQALAVMWDLIKSDYPTSAKRATINRFDEILGLGLSKVKKVKIPKEDLLDVQRLDKARAMKDYATSDALRAKLEKDYVVETTSSGTAITPK